MKRYIAGILSLIMCSLYILNTNQGVKTFTADTTKTITPRKFVNVTDVTVSTISNLKTSNLTLAILVNGRLGNALFEIASGVGIAEFYKVIDLKLDLNNHAEIL